MTICINNNSEDAPNKALKIGCNVWIGAHSFISCGLYITDNVTIAAGSIVLSNIEISSLVMGNPARIIQKNYDNSKLL